MLVKVLAGKGYGHIAHLPTSRLGPGDHKLNEGQTRICCERARDRHDEIIVQEKVDGSCVGVACLKGGQLVPITRSGNAAELSRYWQHELFADWTRLGPQLLRFAWVLREGERLMGEWLAQAHGTRYSLPHEPFVPFDLIVEEKRLPYDEFVTRLDGLFTLPRLIHRGGPVGVELVRERLEPSGHGALDPVEGAVWRVQRRGVVDFLGKWVRSEKIDGVYLPEVSGKDAVWNWQPPKKGQD